MDFKNRHKIKVSIITVCLNSEKTIKTTLDSVANQSYKTIEHIIIDGKSTDRTISIVKKYPHIKKVISEPDRGIYDAMNKGIKIANGDIISFLNSDDFYANNNVLSKVIGIFNSKSNIDACYSDLVYTERWKINKNIRYWKSKNFLPGLFSKGWCPPHTTFFARQSIYKKFGGFDLKYKIAADVELMMRFLEVFNISAIYVPELWVKMRSGGTTNKNIKNIIEQNLEILHALQNHNLTSNKITFFVYKFFSRSFQFLRSGSLWKKF